MNYLKSFIDLLYPPLCCVCHNALVHQERFICLNCLTKAPYIRAEAMKEIEALFWGIIPTEEVQALWYYNKGSKYSKVIHQIKYQGKKELAIYLGQLLAHNKNNEFFFNDIDAIIPIPIHKKKLKTRGYNQAEYIAKGVELETKIPVLNNIIIKSKETASQTTKSSFERHINPMNSFRLIEKEAIQGKHILLVDDVLTTGATLIACAQELLKIPNLTISIMTLSVSK